MENNLGIVVIGGGHAGCEAALAAARTGQKATLFATNLDSIASMPCNPCVGGSAKGHLVREIDALGGQMGKTIDAAFIQSRMLNKSKGPAVYSLRAQADKRRYGAHMRRQLENEANVTLRQSEVTGLVVENGKIAGVKTESGAAFGCLAVVVCVGTYLNARCLYGETSQSAGPGGARPSFELCGDLKRHGFDFMRFKTGTPARIHRRSVDFSKMEEQPGDETIVPFSFETDPESIKREQISCHLTYTTEATHETIRRQLHRSPLYTGRIEGAGARYCPSIEDKVVRFADKGRHPVFIEPEGEDTCEMYAQGLSSSLPEDVQLALYRSVPGLENCEIMRNAYAIEYDCIDATALKPSLEAKSVGGLFFAGQINGSSGYEEAAAQGLVAGINASLYAKGREPLVLDRADAYIGVLIDDLVTKGTKEPYRMMTSRAEYRLLLRQDNSDLRLTEKGYAAGLIPQERYGRFKLKEEIIRTEIERAGNTYLSPGAELNGMLARHGSSPISSGAKLTELVKRPELSYLSLRGAAASPARKPSEMEGYVWDAALEQIEIQLKYEGYIRIQSEQAKQFRALEQKRLPEGLDYDSVPNLRLEA
ncbi:MAG: tRNA uridine-5-carboxymethylaminomethyl(34) synthesis enzyme MnmG, partial [Defluviitaleaceae bacterium]|nr:tRNA uridine-5-carboxymethylaminomethyl(34) synthesis enzyme MnmG [Defluviitaleaceae bacterium]